MTEDPDGRGSSDLARDWITIWQSELSAAATDRDRAESLARLVSAWGHAGAASLAMAVQADGSAGRAAAQPPPRPAPVDAAPDAGARIELLLRRIDELERRLAGLEHPAPG